MIPVLSEEQLERLLRPALIPPDADHEDLRIDARILHTAWQIQTPFDKWIRRRITDAELAENEDFGVFDKFVENPLGGRPAKEYWLSLRAIDMISMVESGPLGKQFRRWFADQADIVRRQKTTQVLDLKDPHALAKALHRQTGAYLELHDKWEATEKEKVVAVAALTESRNNLAGLRQQHALEERCQLLTDWLRDTKHLHGHGPVEGRKVMSMRRYLLRELVKGCETATESRAASEMIARGYLLHKTAQFEKTRSNPKGSAQPVIGENGVTKTGKSNRVLITGKGKEKFLKWFLENPMTRLRKLVQLDPTGPIKELAGRYSVFEKDEHAYGELDEQEKHKCVVLRQLDDKSWIVWARATAADTRYTEARGADLNTALLALAILVKEVRTKQQLTLI